jgi:E3 ubiquitin-protein ligase synoviolin
MNSLFFILWMIDFIMFIFAVESTVTNGISGMVLFASEVGSVPI